MPDDEIPSAEKPNEPNDSPGGHLPYDPPTPAELHDLFESPEEMAYQRKLANEAEPPPPEPPEPELPGGASVVPDLQPIVETDFSEPGEHLDEPPAPAPPAPAPAPARASADTAGLTDEDMTEIVDDLATHLDLLFPAGTPRPPDLSGTDVETRIWARSQSWRRFISHVGDLLGRNRPAGDAPPPDSTAVESVIPDLQKTVVLDPGDPSTWQAPEPPPTPGQVESVVPDLQPVVETNLSETGGPGGPPAKEPPPPKPPAEISLEAPPDDGLRWQIPRWSSVRLPIPGKPVVVWGVAVGVGVAGVATAVALLGGGKSHAHAALPATSAAAPAATTTAAAPVTETTAAAAAPANEPPTVSPITAVLTKRPPPPASKQQTNCGAANNPCLGLPLKPVTVRYTTYTVGASDPEGRTLTYRWANTNSCGVFRATGASAVWSFPDPGTCPKGSLPMGTVSVVVSDGKHTCTVRYPAGSAPGRGPAALPCTPR